MKFKITPSFLAVIACLTVSISVVGGVAVNNILDGIVSATNRASGVVNNLAELGALGSQVVRRGPIGHALSKIFTDVDDGNNPINFAGGNAGAYYNFMFPDNDDYPWACVCNEHDLKQYRAKNLPFARCRNQEDLSYQNIQANCDPNNSASTEF